MYYEYTGTTTQVLTSLQTALTSTIMDVICRYPQIY